MNITQVTSPTNVANIKSTSAELLALLKGKKLFFKSEYRGEQRIKGSETFLIIWRALNNDRFTSVTSSDEDALTQLNTLTNKMTHLLVNNTALMALKVSDYTKDVTPRLSRETIPYLDNLYMEGEINLDDINTIYQNMGKPTPKKFSRIELDNDSQAIYSALSANIAETAQSIKANMIAHYETMVKRIDPHNTIDSAKEFIKKGLRDVSDINTVRLCVTYKFDNARFMDMLHHEFEVMIMVASSKISDHSPKSEGKPNITINSVDIGGKGFDVSARVNGKSLYARAITAEGPFVRFHYRYIIS